MLLSRVSVRSAKNLVGASSRILSAHQLNGNAVVAVVGVNPRMREYTAKKKNVAILMTGAGFMDGSEITETVSLLIHLTESGFTPLCFAPDGDSVEIYDHMTKNVEKNEVRNMINEVSRISRNKVLSYKLLRSKANDALVIPGGHGINNTLSNYVEDPHNFTVDQTTKDIIQEFRDEKKPILVTSNAVILMANLLGKKNGGPGVKLTAGGDGQLEETFKDFGAEAVNTKVTGVVHDLENNIISTPAFSDRLAQFNNVHTGIGNAVADLAKGVRGVKDVEIDWDFHDFYVTKCRGRSKEEWEILKAELKARMEKEKEKAMGTE